MDCRICLLIIFGVSVTVLTSRGLVKAQTEVPVRYDGFHLWRISPQTDVELHVVDFIVNKYNLSYWLYPSSVGRPIDIMLSPSTTDHLFSFFKRSFKSFEILQTDIQGVIDDQYKDRAASGHGYAYNKYHPLDKINAWMDQQIATYGKYLSKQEIGKSYEGRPMYLLKISTGAERTRNGSANNKKSIFIEGGIHAREWISPATVIYMTNQLLKQYDSSSEVKMILDEFDWYILPVFNVDGYEYTWTTDRLWRKTRSPTINPLCRGTDPNRNWDNHWCESGASKVACSELYCGSRPFSEVEVQAVSKFLQSGLNIRGFIDFHSYSQLWMTPWGWTNNHPKDYFKQNTQSKRSVEALEAVHGTQYEYGTIANTLYLAAGNSVDWVYENVGVPYSATVELRDQGQTGFLLPASEIIPTGQETFEGLKQFALFILTNP